MNGTAPGPYHHAHGARGRAPTLNARDIALALLVAGQFLLQFFAIAGRLPPGLASVIVHTQAFFTVLFAAAAFGERPSPGRLYLGLVATVLAYAIWGGLLRRYPATTVAPFSLLVPFVAALSAAAVFGETFGPLRLAGMALVLVGLALSALPGASSRLWPRRPTASRQHA